MSVIEDNINKIISVTQEFMDEYGLADPEPEVTYTDNALFITIHLGYSGMASEDVDLLELETRLGTIPGFSDIDVTADLSEPVELTMVGTDEYDDGEHDAEDTGLHLCEEPDIPEPPELVDTDSEIVLKELMDERVLAGVEVDDSYVATEEDMQDLYERFDDYSRLDELEDMGDWE